MLNVLSITKYTTREKIEAPRVHSRVVTRDYAGSRVSVERRPKTITKSYWLRFLGVSLVACNILLLGLHVVQANRYAVKVYEITELRNTITSLQEENKKLSLRFSENTSIVGVQQIMAEKRFVPVTVTEFIKPSSPVSIK